MIDDDWAAAMGMTAEQWAAAPAATDDPPATPAGPAAAVHAGTRRVTGGNDRDFWYVGVVKTGGRVIVECGHEHRNRDISTGANGRSAKDCAEQIISGAQRHATARHYAGRRADASNGMSPLSFTTRTREIARADADADAQAYLEAVALVRTELAR